MTDTAGSDAEPATGSGSMSLAAVSGHARESAAQTAYRAYLAHRPGCSQCTNHAVQCDTANQLWAAFKAARAAA
jgi:hypothetical protein